MYFVLLYRKAAMSKLGSIIVITTVTAVLMSNAVAQADPQTDQYTRQNMPAVCFAMDKNPTVEGIDDEGLAIMNDGMTAEQSMEIIMRSIIGWCPEHMPELEAFVAKWQKAGTKHG